ncbi:hypothetical protein M0804_011620 [Polistes exclamans]|nr:hypothetical protein M0804_011620 [Polistes exclamans]
MLRDSEKVKGGGIGIGGGGSGGGGGGGGGEGKGGVEERRSKKKETSGMRLSEIEEEWVKVRTKGNAYVSWLLMRPVATVPTTVV